MCIDFLTLDKSECGFEKVLVITDHFNIFAVAILTKDQSAKTTATALFILHYGVPLSIHSDQCANFNGKLIGELCSLMSMKKSRTNIYHLSGNGMCKRFNITLMNMLGTLEDDQKKDWNKHISSMAHAYNAAPFYLTFGRQDWLPVD